MPRRSEDKLGQFGGDLLKTKSIKKPDYAPLERAMTGRETGRTSVSTTGTPMSDLLKQKVTQPTAQPKKYEYAAGRPAVKPETTAPYAAGRDQVTPVTPYAPGLQVTVPSKRAEPLEMGGVAAGKKKASLATPDWKAGIWEARAQKAVKETQMDRYNPRRWEGTGATEETGQGEFQRYIRPPSVWELRNPAQVQYELEELEKQYAALYQDAVDTLDRAEWSGDWAEGMAEAAQKYQEAFALSPQINDLKKELEEIEDSWQRYLMEQEGYREATLWDSTVGSFKQGYNTAELGKESYKEMMGDVDSRRAEYEEKLAGEEYKFVPESWWKEAISSVSSWGGELLSKTADPLTLGLMGSYAGAAALSGNAGPQALLPEEGITVPGAMVAGFEMGRTTNDIKIQAGLAYDELRKNGVSKDTAQTIAMAVGGVNGLLGALPEELLKESFNILKNSGTSTMILQTIVNELKKRGVNILWGTAQDVAQEGVTIAGVQAGTKMDTGQWAYSAEEVGDRLKNTAVDSILTNGILEIPGAVKNIGADIGRQIQQSGWICDQVARSMLGDFDMMDFLTRRGGLSITKDMNLNQKITAMKNAVTAVLQKKGNRLQGGSG